MLKQTFIPPKFKDNELTRRVRLYYSIIIVISITALIPGSIVVAFPGVSLWALLPISLILLTGVGTLFMARKGQVQLAP